MLQSFVRIFKAWTLPIAMVIGVLGYLLYAALPLSEATRVGVAEVSHLLQPTLIFLILFLSLCRMEFSSLRLYWWHLWLLLIQLSLCLLMAMPLLVCPDSSWALFWQGSMLCMITPTASAASVITLRLGGRMESVITYTVLANILSAATVSLLFPLVEPHEGLRFLSAFGRIVAHLFPTLIVPCLAAFLVQRLAPRLCQWFVRCKGLPFYLWALVLCIAIGITVKSMFEYEVGWGDVFSLVVASLLCCLLQFVLGWIVGVRNGDRISIGQSIGQKNTVVAIWMASSFLNPLVAMVGGFYSVWQNIINSYQLSIKSKTE